MCVEGRVPGVRSSTWGGGLGRRGCVKDEAGSWLRSEAEGCHVTSQSAVRQVVTHTSTRVSMEQVVKPLRENITFT